MPEIRPVSLMLRPLGKPLAVKWSASWALSCTETWSPSLLAWSAGGGHQPVAVAGWGRRHAHDGRVQFNASRAAIAAGVAEGEDAAVGGHQPVAVTRWGRRHAHDGRVQFNASRAAIAAGVAEGED